jgi:hypothetical protein
MPELIRRESVTKKKISIIMEIQPNLIDPIAHTDWEIQNWKIKFLLSDRVLGLVKKQSKLENWYEDPAVSDAWIERMCVCVYSIQRFHQTFGALPHVGDRLFDNTITGATIEERAIDGYLMTITFTLST